MRVAGLIAAPLLVFPLAACQPGARPAPPRADAVVAPDAADAAASPRNPRDRARAEAWAAALRGLDFEAGVVTITEPEPRDPVRAEALVASGHARLEMNHRVEAVADFAAAVRAEDDRRDAYMGLGQALQTRGEYAMAAASFRTAADRDAGDAEARTMLARMLEMQGDRAAAIDTMQDVLRIDADYGAAHERLAVWLYYEGDIAAAWAHARAAEQAGTPVPPQLLELLREAEDAR